MECKFHWKLRTASSVQGEFAGSMDSGDEFTGMGLADLDELSPEKVCEVGVLVNDGEGEGVRRDGGGGRSGEASDGS